MPIIHLSKSITTYRKYLIRCFELNEVIYLHDEKTVRNSKYGSLIITYKISLNTLII